MRPQANLFFILVAQAGLTALALDVTFYEPVVSASGILVDNPPGEVLGVEPVSVDDGGLTYYVGSQRLDPWVSTAGGATSTLRSEATTSLFTFRADASRHFYEHINTASDAAITKGTTSCEEDANGFMVCVVLAEHAARPETVEGDRTRPAEPEGTRTLTISGERSAWFTLKNAETFKIPQPTGTGDKDDTGGASGGSLERVFAASSALLAYSFIMMLM